MKIFNKVHNFMSIDRTKFRYIDENIRVTVFHISTPNTRWWEYFFTDAFIHTRGMLYQISGTCWLNCIINLILLSPISDEAKSFYRLKYATTMTFGQIANPPAGKTFKQLFFALLKNLLLRNTYPHFTDGNIMLPIAARLKSIINNDDETKYHDITYGDGSTRVGLTCVYVLKLFMQDTLHIIDLYTSYNTKSALIRIIGNKPIKDSIRYIVMCGVFYNATKEIMIGKNIYDLIGGIIIIMIENSNSHAICGIMVKNNEYIVDSNNLKLYDRWTNCTLFKYKVTMKRISDIYLCNCIYKLR